MAFYPLIQSSGGLISAALLSVAGASSFYIGGQVIYTLPSRIKYAGWTKDTVKTYSGPSPDVVQAISEYVRSDLEADWCVGESGTAGPTGGETRNRTPGYVALSVTGKDGTKTAELETGSSDREDNMLAFTKAALELLLSAVEEKGKL